MTIEEDTLKDLGFSGEPAPGSSGRGGGAAEAPRRRTFKEVLTTPIGHSKKLEPGQKQAQSRKRVHGTQPGPSRKPEHPQADAAAAEVAVPAVRLIGAEPRVDLLPPQVRLQRRRTKTARRLGLVLVGVVVIVGAGIGGTWYLAGEAQQRLTDAQAETQTILQQQAKYMSVRNVKADVALVGAAQKVGASTEIDWKSYLTRVQNTLPAGVTITTVNIGSASPLAAYAQATAPLQGARVATLSFAAVSPKLPEIPTWLRSLAALPGYADGVPGTVTRNDDGTYTANVTVHINSKAFDGRFMKAGDADATSTKDGGE